MVKKPAYEELENRILVLEKSEAELKKNLKSLRKSEILFRTIIENAPVMINSFTENGRCLLWNDQCRKTFGWTIDEINAHEDVLSVFYPDSAVREKVQAAIFVKADGRFRQWHPLAKDGKTLTTMWANYCLSDGMIISLGYDITERKQIEEKLRYRIKLEELIADISTRFVGISSDKIDDEINRALALIGRFTGIDRSFLFLFSEDGTEFNNTHEWCAPGIKPQLLEFQGLAAASFPWWMEKLKRNEIQYIPDVDALPSIAEAEKKIFKAYRVQSLTSVPLTSGSTIYGFMGFHTERTEKSWAEEDRALLGTVGEIITQRLEKKRADETLLKSEQRYRSLFENAQIGFFRIRLADRMCLEANQRFIDMFGYETDDGFLERLLSVDHYADSGAKSRIIAIVKEKGGLKNHEVRLKKKDGTIWWGRLSGKFHEKEGTFGGVISDITEMKMAEDENALLEEQYRQAQKVEAIGQLAGGVAHDMNNLLTPILGYSELLLGKLEPDDNRRQSVERIAQAGKGCQDLVRQLLAFGRKQTLEYHPLDINNVIRTFRHLLKQSLREDIDLRTILAPNIKTTRADIGQIEQVIMNLCVNARDAMPNGGSLILETAMVELDRDAAALSPDTKEGRYVMLAVSDTGCGMDKKILDQAFEPFFSTKGDQGTGLGLATVYGIIKQHQGNIWVYSEPGKGTTVKIYLPVFDGVRLEKKKERKSDENLRGAETILLVEDNGQVRRFGIEALLQHGYTVLTAKNGADALARMAVHEGPIHLLLTDVIMPGINGKELYGKASKNNPGLKVLYMSGYTDNVIAHHGVLNEGVQFIQKPFTLHGLAVKVREVLAQDD